VFFLWNSCPQVNEKDKGGVGKKKIQPEEVNNTKKRWKKEEEREMKDQRKNKVEKGEEKAFKTYDLQASKSGKKKKLMGKSSGG